jgi:2-polyprenyl-6-methoxyphenol hydroxylase-like FAD-dependent oxidoreductase
MYDVIVVGARAAGATTAMLLARKGLRVLVVDRAGFPSDTLSTHQVQVPGIARLARWGLLDRLVAAGTPATRRVRFNQPGVTLAGEYGPFEGVDAMFSPRRTLLDALLVDAARSAGAEVREHVTVSGLLFEDGRVAGIRATAKGGTPVTERAHLVVGADGKHSLVARAVDATSYDERPPLTVAAYTYWEGVPLDGGEMHGADRRAAGVWPTNDGLAMTYVAWPAAEFGDFRADVEGNLLSTLDGLGDLGARVRAGRRVERIRSTPDLPAFFRVPYGPGWALVGDAGLTLDPMTGQGIGYAFRDAELLADAVADGLGGTTPLDAALAGYHAARDRAAKPMADFTAQLASFAPPPPEARVLFESLVGRPKEITRFLGMLTGTVPVDAFFAPRNLFRVLGVRGMARVAAAKARSRGRKPAVAAA